MENRKESTRETKVAAVWFLLILQCQEVWRGQGEGAVIMNGLPTKKFEKLADINIGVLMSMTDNHTACSDRLSPSAFETFPEIISFAVDRVNKNHILPRGLKLGFVALDDCSSEQVAALQSFAFLPQTDSCPPPTSDTYEGQSVQKSYDVVAVIGAFTSSLTVAAVEVLTLGHVPLMSVFATSDKLSDRRNYPYFLRIIPPVSYQFDVITRTVKQFGWNYVSVLFEEDSFGRRSFEKLKGSLKRVKCCLAVVQSIPVWSRSADVESAVTKLINGRGHSRVVVLIMNRLNARLVLEAVTPKLKTKTFVWMAPSSWGRFVTFMDSVASTLLDSLVVDIQPAYLPEFDDWYRNLTPKTTNNPWFQDYWEDLFNCSIAENTCSESLTLRNVNLRKDKLEPMRGYILDTVNIIANATSRILQSDKCTNLGANEPFSKCVTGPELLSELIATQQEGYSGWLEFPSGKGRLVPYTLQQVRLDAAQKLTTVDIAEFDPVSKLWTDVGNVSWSKAILRPKHANPVSYCSPPCRGHQARVVHRTSCCWICEPCDENQRLTDNGTVCELCGPFTWPDPHTNKTTCALITPHKLDVFTTEGYVQLFLAVVCLLMCVFVCIFFIIYRNRRVIKASSLQLSLIMLFAITVGYAAIPIFMMDPTDLWCKITFYLFCFSFALIYGPLLLRSLWIYRIFEAGVKCRQRPPMTDVKHQLLFCFIILLIQAGISAVPMVTISSWSGKMEVSRQENHVELTCHIPGVSMVSFLIYFLLLSVNCLVLAFKTRHLPGNFNESRYIVKCICTNLIIFVCFTPTYLATHEQVVKAWILVYVLLLNCSIALVFLFFSKIYAVVYLPNREGRPTVVSGTAE